MSLEIYVGRSRWNDGWRAYENKYILCEIYPST